MALAPSISNAQELANYNLYMQNGYLYNPAYTIDQNTFSAYLNSHIQWVGFDGAPKVNSFGIHGAFNKNMGLGVNIVNKKYGIMNTFMGQVSYAYRAGFADNNYFTLGVAAGFLNDKIQTNDVHGVDLSDPKLTGDAYKQTTMSGSAGISYFYKNFEAQLILPQLYERKVANFYNVSILSYTHELSNGVWKLKPSVLFRGAKTTPYQYEGNLMAMWNNKIWMQAGYRSSKSMIYSAGVNLGGFNVGYAYQMDNDVLGKVSDGTHEIQIIFNFGKGFADRKPKFADVSGTVKNAFSGEPIVADVIFYDETGVEVYRTTTNDNGRYKADLTPEKSYKVEVKAAGYTTVTDLLPLVKDEYSKTYDASLKPINTMFKGKTGPANATVKIYDDKGALVYTGKSDANGNYEVALEPGKSYKTEVSAENFNTKTENFTMPVDKMEYTQTIILVPYITLKGSVKNKDTGELVTANLKITDESGKVIKQSTVTGTIEMLLPEGKYNIEVSGDNLITLKEKVTLTQATAKDFFLELKVKVLAKDKTFSLGSINFEIGKGVIKPESFVVLDELVQIMTDNPEVKVEVGGHTDNVGVAANNQKLSQTRADACMAYAISKGIAAERLTAVGYGQTKQLVPNTTKENKAKNRRVEFKFVK